MSMEMAILSQWKQLCNQRLSEEKLQILDDPFKFGQRQHLF